MRHFRVSRNYLGLKGLQQANYITILAGGQGRNSRCFWIAHSLGFRCADVHESTTARRQAHGKLSCCDAHTFCWVWADRAEQIIRYRPKGVFGKGVGNRQKCIRNASEMRQKCVKNYWEKRNVQNASEIRDGVNREKLTVKKIISITRCFFTVYVPYKP